MGGHVGMRSPSPFQRYLLVLFVLTFSPLTCAFTLGVPHQTTAPNESISASEFAYSQSGEGISATKCLAVRENQDVTRSLFNTCSFDVEAIWCVTSAGARCRPNSSWTIHAGSGYPIVDPGQHIWFGACKRRLQILDIDKGVYDRLAGRVLSLVTSEPAGRFLDSTSECHTDRDRTQICSGVL